MNLKDEILSLMEEKNGIYLNGEKLDTDDFTEVYYAIKDLKDSYILEEYVDGKCVQGIGSTSHNPTELAVDKVLIEPLLEITNQTILEKILSPFDTDSFDIDINVKDSGTVKVTVKDIDIEETILKLKLNIQGL